MASHSGLFLIADSTIRTYLRRDSRLELQRFEGEENFILGRGLGTFWDWWMRTTGYVAREDRVDFILLADDSAPAAFFPESLIPVPVEESLWTLAQIESHLGSLYPGQRLRLQEATTAENGPATPGLRAGTGLPQPHIMLSALPARSLLDGSLPASEEASPVARPDQPSPPLARGGAVSDHFREKTEMIRNMRR